jgi:hypothetical protein
MRWERRFRHNENYDVAIKPRNTRGYIEIMVRKTVQILNFIHNVMFRFIFHVTTVLDYVRLSRSFVNDVTVSYAQWTTAHQPVTRGASPWGTIADVRLG